MDPALQQLIEGKKEDEIEVIARLQKPNTVPENFRVITAFDTIVTGRIQRNDIYTIWADKRIASLKASRSVNQALVRSIPVVKKRKKQLQKSIVSEAVLKKQVVVGIADWGFDFTHPNFRNQDDSTRFLAIWNQAAPYDGSNPYGYGEVYTAAMINEALQSKTPFKTLNYHPAIADASGIGSHGTHVLDIAAGNGSVGDEGNAPSSYLVAVHLGTSKAAETFSLGDQSRLLESVDFMHTVAQEKPLVINLSVGSHGDAHRGMTLVEQAFDKFLLANKGRAIVQSAGNYYTVNAHASGRVLHGGEKWLQWEIKPNDYTTNELEIWYPGKDSFTVTLYGKGYKKVVSARGENATILNNVGEEIGKIYHRSHEPNTGLNHIDIFLYNNSTPLQWKVKIQGDNVVDGRYNAWIERDGSIRTQSQFNPVDVDRKVTLGTICNGFYTIAVGAYDDMSAIKKIAKFSSSGPTADGRIKPDVVAPGVQIIAAKSASRKEAYSKGNLTMKSGTSMASPFIAGLIARLFQESDELLSIQETRRLLFKSLHNNKNVSNSHRIGNGYINLQKFQNNIKSIIRKKNKDMRPYQQHTTHTTPQYTPEVMDNVLETYTERVKKYIPSYMPFLEHSENAYQETLPSSGLTWTGATSAQINFMRNVYDINLRRSSSRGTFVADVPASQLATVEGRYQLKTAAAASCRLMFQDVRRAIATQGVNVTIGLTSAYRSASHQFRLWNRYFINQYYSATQSHRRTLNGGEHGVAAQQYLARYIRGRIATPGFSNHNQGLAIDIRNTENGVTLRNRTRTTYTNAWRRTQLWNWLTTNAARYHFYQNTRIDEPWHWEYRPPTTGVSSPPGENFTWTDEVKLQWINEKKLEKTFFASEPQHNLCLLPLPEWFDKAAFQSNFIQSHGAVANEILGNPDLPVTANYFVIHDTAVTRDITRSRASRKGIHFWLNINNAILAKDWNERGSGVKIERGSNGCFVHTELTRHPQLNAAVPNVKDAGTYYTYRQYELLAYAYVICCIRKGRLIETTIHREVDRSVEYHTSSGRVRYGHGDPKHFNINTFYAIVNSLLQMPTSNFTYGIQEARVLAQGQSNRAGYKNVFIPYVDGTVNRANQYGAIEHRTNSAGARIRGNYIVNNIRVRRRC